MRTFLTIWAGQLVSLLGSSLTGFALGIWVYEQNGSVTQFALISLAGQIPGIVVAPFAGAVVDRFNRRTIMILSDVGAFFSTVIVILLLRAGLLEIWHILVLTIWAASLGAFQSLAYTTSVTFLVDKKHFGRVSGLMQLASGVSRLIAPILGGILLVLIEIEGVVLIDMATFFFALLTLFIIRIPDKANHAQTTEQKSSMKEDLTKAWTYLRARKELINLLIYFLFMNFFVGLIGVSTIPMILGLTTKPMLGTILSVGGSGLIVGSLIMSAWGGPKRLMNGFFGFQTLMGLGVFLSGIRPSLVLLSVASFIFSFSIPLVFGCSQAIWLKKVAPEMQGRVMAFRRVIAWSSLPLSYLIAGPLADKLFEPMLAVGGGLADSPVGQIIGVGPGRGIAFLFTIIGLVILIMTVIGFRIPALRFLESRLPDAVPDRLPEKADAQPAVAPIIDPELP